MPWFNNQRLQAGNNPIPKKTRKMSSQAANVWHGVRKIDQESAENVRKPDKEEIIEDNKALSELTTDEIMPRRMGVLSTETKRKNIMIT